VHRYPDVRVIALDKLDYCASLRNLQSVADKPNFKFVKGDICSGDLVSYLLETEKVDTVMHFAAQTHVDNSFGNSLAFTLNNTYGEGVVLKEREVESFLNSQAFQAQKTRLIFFSFLTLIIPLFSKTQIRNDRHACRPGGVQGGRRERGEGEEGAAGEFCCFSLSLFYVCLLAAY